MYKPFLVIWQWLTKQKFSIYMRTVSWWQKTFFYYVFMFQPFQVTNSTVSKWKIEAFFFVSTVRAMTFQGWPIFMFYSIVGYHNQINLYSEDEKWSTKRLHNFFGSRKILVSFQLSEFIDRRRWMFKRHQELHLCALESDQTLSCMDYLLQSWKTCSYRVISRTLELIKLVPHLFSFHGLNKGKT